VTVVATGLGATAAAVAAHAARLDYPRSAATVRGAQPAREDVLARDGAGARQPKAQRGPVDYSNLDRPTIVRQRAVGDGIRAEPEPEELLDIPACGDRRIDGRRRALAPAPAAVLA
jgi:hypothetical protein